MILRCKVGSLHLPATIKTAARTHLEVRAAVFIGIFR